MSTLTTNMQLVLPALTELADIAVINTNMSSILDIHDHSTNTKGLAVGRLAATTALAAAGTTFSTGALTVTNLVTASAGLTVTAGGLTVTAGGATVTAGGLTVTAGNVGIGLAAQANAGIYLAGSLTTGINQYGMTVQPTSSSGATSSVEGVTAVAATAAAAFTATQVIDFHALTPSRGAGSTITTAYGLLVDPITTVSTTNYGIYVGTPSGAANNVGVRLAGGTPALLIDAGGLQVTVGNVGIGTAATANTGLGIVESLSGSTAQYGINSSITGSSAATTEISGIVSYPATAAAAFTSTTVASFHAGTITKGAGSTITSAFGLLVDAVTVGNTNNYGLYVGTPSGGATENIGLFIAGGGFKITGTYNFANAGIGTGGGATATMTTAMGGSGPATANINGWLQVQIGGVNSWVPYWR